MLIDNSRRIGAFVSIGYFEWQLLCVIVGNEAKGGYPTAAHISARSERASSGTVPAAGSPKEGEAVSRSSSNSFVTRCQCGHDRSNPSVQPVRRYSLWGMMGLIMGYTALPKRIDVICARCGAVFDSITNKMTLERFRYAEPGPDVK